MRISDSELRGRTVIGSDGQALGEVSALYLESDTWRLETVKVKLRKAAADQIGATHSFFRGIRAGSFEFPARLIQSIGDAVVLSVPLEELRRIAETDLEQPHA